MSKVAQVPQLRFPEFSGVWRENRLGNIARIFDGTHQTPKYVENGIPFYSVEHITANQFDDTKYISEEVFERENMRVKLEREDILMTRIGNIGMAKYIDWNVSASFYVSLALIKKNESFNSKFLSQLIHSPNFQRQLWKRTIHVAFPQKINLGEIGKCESILPTKPEQQKIAAFLTSVDNKIEQLSKKKELLGEYKKGLMQKIFSQAIRFKADDGGTFPDWEEKSLGDLIVEISDGGTPPTSNKGNFGGDINWVVIDDIRDEIRSTKVTLTETGLSNSSSKLWKPETIILSTGATIGRVGITKIYTATKQGVCGIVVNQFTSNLFLKYWFIFNINLLKRFSQGSSIKEVRPPTLIRFDISTPSLLEQTKIASLLSSIDNKIEQVGKQLDESKQFKKALLQQMFV